jgi:hypothetical protein
MSRKHFFILCLILMLALLVIAALVTLYVIIPVVVRSIIHETELSFQSMTICEMEQDRFRLKAQLSLRKTHSIPATILAPLPIEVNTIGTLYNNESISIRGDPSDLSMDGSFIVSNMDDFYAFTRTLIFNDQIEWNLKAKVTIRPLWKYMLSYTNIPFDKDINMTALHGLHQVSLEMIRFNRSNDHQLLIDLKININNPSIVTIDLGKLHHGSDYLEPINRLTSSNSI